jgi:hypothetical protein
MYHWHSELLFCFQRELPRAELGSMSRSIRTLDVLLEDRLLIQINPLILLLHAVHLSAKRRKD